MRLRRRNSSTLSVCRSSANQWPAAQLSQVLFTSVALHRLPHNPVQLLHSPPCRERGSLSYTVCPFVCRTDKQASDRTDEKSELTELNHVNITLSQNIHIFCSFGIHELLIDSNIIIWPQKYLNRMTELPLYQFVVRCGGIAYLKLFQWQINE